MDAARQQQWAMCVREDGTQPPASLALACRLEFIQVPLLEAAQESGATSAAVKGKRKP